MEIVQVNSIKAWLLAARPKTLAGAATPVLLGCALAYADSRHEKGNRPDHSNSLFSRVMPISLWRD